jgi:hypothetical protein
MSSKKLTAFQPKFTITPTIANGLMRIEAVRQAIQTLPITPRALAHLRETSRLFSTHYSTMIEGNRLTQEQVAQVMGGDSHFPGRERESGRSQRILRRSGRSGTAGEPWRAARRSGCGGSMLW